MSEVFLGREALADGVSRHDLQRWYRRMFRGVCIPKYVSQSLRNYAYGAWLYTDRTGVIAGVAASALHGAHWVDDDEPIEVLVNERRRQPGLTVRMDRLADDEVESVDGLLVTTPSRTAFDMGRYLKRAAALARLDALMRAAPFAAEDVEMLMFRYGAVRGVRQLRDLLPLVDSGAESTAINTAATVVNTSETFDVYRWSSGTGGKSFGSSRKTDTPRCCGERRRHFFAEVVPRSTRCRNLLARLLRNVGSGAKGA